MVTLPPIVAWKGAFKLGGPGIIPTILEVLTEKGMIPAAGVDAAGNPIVSGSAGIWDVFHENAAPQIVTDRDLDRQGNVVAFGPVAQEYSELEALLIVLYFVKSMKTPDGQKHLKDIIVAYLNNTGRAISAMQEASCSHVYTALINQYTCTNIYARLGLITPYDQLQTKTFLDHYFGELLKKDYVLQGVTTLVKAGMESAGELATLAKVLSKE